MRQPVDRYSVALHDIARALLRGDRATAEREASAIAFEPNRVARPVRPRISELAAIYERDRYQCRYCGIRTISPAVMPLLSQTFPLLLPWHPNWKADSTHPVYLLQSTTNDHIVPAAWGGHPSDPDNLVTACWPCNAAKADVPLDSLLGWRLRGVDEADPTWHGLADLHESLWRALGEPEVPGVAKQWLTVHQQLYASNDDR